MKINDINYQTLKTSIEIYKKVAFPEGVPEDSFNYPLFEKVEKAVDFDSLFSCFKKEEPEKDKIKYSIQLGSLLYPCLKLVISKFNHNDYGFLVDRHTEYLSITSDSENFNKEVEIKQYTKNIKLKIEEEWEKKGIETFRKLVRVQTEKDTEKISSMDIKKLGYSIILVEDDDDIANLHKLEIEIHGYDVTIAKNGELALQLLEKKDFNAMVLDLMMPSISGFEVLKLCYNRLPVIVLSAIADKMTIENCMRDGAKAYLIKPTDATVIAETIKKAIEGD